jgi:hypothetical protein
MFEQHPALTQAALGGLDEFCRERFYQLRLVLLNNTGAR